MTYKELEELVHQQGNRCSPNLGMSSAVLVVDTKYGMDETRCLNDLALAFGFSKDDISPYEEVLYKDAVVKLAKLFTELQLRNAMPIVKFAFKNSFSDGYSFVVYNLLSFSCSIYIGEEESTATFVVAGDEIIVYQSYDFPERPTA